MEETKITSVPHDLGERMFNTQHSQLGEDKVKIEFPEYRVHPNGGKRVNQTKPASYKDIENLFMKAVKAVANKKPKEEAFKYFME